MKQRPFTYLFWIQYLGLRYHGWQKQPNLKTVQGRIEKSAKFVLGHEDFMILGASRTDAKVSCNQGAFELFNIASLDVHLFAEEMNKYLPDDIRILDGQKVPAQFNIIHSVTVKEYHYYFCFENKIHPFASGNITHVKTALNIEAMKEGAKLFVGTHDFRRFCTKNKNTDNFVREIFESEIFSSSIFSGGYFPDNIYFFKIKGRGFLTHQVRIMMEALFRLGQGKINFRDIQDALCSEESEAFCGKSPAHGLVLEKVIFKN